MTNSKGKKTRKRSRFLTALLLTLGLTGYDMYGGISKSSSFTNIIYQHKATSK